MSVLGGVAEVARELAYRLYTICERKKRAPEALSYNALVQSWPEITPSGDERNAHRKPRKRKCSNRDNQWQSQTTNASARLSIC